MAIPYLFSASFDTGDNSEWDSEADTGTLLDFPHFATLARIPGYPAPYRGAYCMRIQPGDTNDHTLTEGDIDIADGATRWIRFALFLSSDFGATADDDFNIFEFQQTDNTIEGSIGLSLTASTDVALIGMGDGAAPASYPAFVTKGVWHVVEASYTVSTGGSGAFELFLDGASVQSGSSLTNAAAVGQGVLGTQATLSTTASGFLLFDEFAFDDTRLAIADRWAPHRLLTTTSFVALGPGKLGNVKVIDGGGGDVAVELYDTDIYTSSMTPMWFGQIGEPTGHSYDATQAVEFSRGCLAVLSGTSPAANIQIARATGWGSDGAVRAYGASRRTRII